MKWNIPGSTHAEILSFPRWVCATTYGWSSYYTVSACYVNPFFHMSSICPPASFSCGRFLHAANFEPNRSPLPMSIFSFCQWAFKLRTTNYFYTFLLPVNCWEDWEKIGDYLMPRGVNVKKPNLVEIRAEQGGINMHAQTRLAVGMTRRAACRV